MTTGYAPSEGTSSRRTTRLAHRGANMNGSRRPSPGTWLSAFLAASVAVACLAACGPEAAVDVTDAVVKGVGAGRAVAHHAGINDPVLEELHDNLSQARRAASKRENARKY